MPKVYMAVVLPLYIVFRLFCPEPTQRTGVTDGMGFLLLSFFIGSGLILILGAAAQFLLSRRRPAIRTLMLASLFSAVFGLYLVEYCLLVERVVLRGPSTTGADGKVRTQLFTYPAVRGHGEEHPILWRLFEPAFDVDRQFVRTTYWEEIQIEKSGERRQ
jgi:hypothetical protein